MDKCDEPFVYDHPFLDDKTAMEYFYCSIFYEKDSINERMLTQGVSSLKELKYLKLLLLTNLILVHSKVLSSILSTKFHEKRGLKTKKSKRYT